MAFNKKIWKDRIVEFAGRRKLVNINKSEEEVYDIERAEGEVSQAGDAFSAENMNDLEQRIADTLGECSFVIKPDGAYVEYRDLSGEEKSKKLGEATLDGTAVDSDVLENKTFYNISSDQKEVGTMNDYQDTTLTASVVTKDDEYTYLGFPGRGCVNQNTKVRTLNSNLDLKIKADSFTSVNGKKTVDTGIKNAKMIITASPHDNYAQFTGVTSESIHINDNATGIGMSDVNLAEGTFVYHRNTALETKYWVIY